MLSKGKAKEGQNVFGSGSMTGIAITLFIKNPKAQKQGKIYYCDIGDDLKTEEKLEKISQLKSIEKILADNLWQEIVPDSHGDWINQRDKSFANHISLGDKRNKSEAVIFENYSRGIATSRDAWCYNFSKNQLAQNMSGMIDFYNCEVSRYKKACDGLAKENFPKVSDFISNDSQKISWSFSLIKNDIPKHKTHPYEESSLNCGLYRPFIKEWCYFSKKFNDAIYQMPKIFPDASVENLVICVSGVGARSGFSALITDQLPNLHSLDTGQCFPLKLFSPKTNETSSAQDLSPQDSLFTDAPKPASLFDEKTEGNFVVKDGITDAGLAHFLKNYAGEKISKEDVFYYIYGLLHSEDYKQRFADNLTKELPRIPRVKKAADFWYFSKAGRELAELHINYENVSPFAANFAGGNLAIEMLKDADFKVEKMKFAKVGKETNKTKVIYNSKITIENIPLEAYEYVVNGKPAIEWVMERQGISTHKESGIVNDANLWAIETMNNARYPLDLLLRVITVSLETTKIVHALPKLEI
jgi:predicted helicase